MTAPQAQAAKRRVPLIKNVFYRFVRATSRLLSVFIFDFRAFGRENAEFDGAALLLCTHQSHLDPLLIGMTFNERLNYLARRSLFKSKIFGTIITLLDAIELDRDRSGLAGLKETLTRLKQGQKVLVFPEGTRSYDGQIAPLKPGFLAVARRSRVPLVPIAVTGAFEAMPRTTMWVRRYPLRIAIGQPIQFEEFAELDETSTLALITERLQACYRRAQESRT